MIKNYMVYYNCVLKSCNWPIPLIRGIYQMIKLMVCSFVASLYGWASNISQTQSKTPLFPSSTLGLIVNEAVANVGCILSLMWDNLSILSHVFRSMFSNWAFGAIHSGWVNEFLLHRGNYDSSWFTVDSGSVLWSEIRFKINHNKTVTRVPLLLSQ